MSTAGMRVISMSATKIQATIFVNFVFLIFLLHFYLSIITNFIL